LDFFLGVFTHYDYAYGTIPSRSYQSYDKTPTESTTISYGGLFGWEYDQKNWFFNLYFKTGLGNHQFENEYEKGLRTEVIRGHIFTFKINVLIGLKL
jgi:hypothetical protein